MDCALVFANSEEYRWRKRPVVIEQGYGLTGAIDMETFWNKVGHYES